MNLYPLPTKYCFPFGVTVRMKTDHFVEQLRSVWLSDTHRCLQVKSRILSVMRYGLFFTEFVAGCHPSQFEADERMLGSSACWSVLNIDECLPSGWIIYNNRHYTWAPLFNDVWRTAPFQAADSSSSGVLTNVTAEYALLSCQSWGLSWTNEQG
jgi:hypothetical protein